MQIYSSVDFCITMNIERFWIFNKWPLPYISFLTNIPQSPEAIFEIKLAFGIAAVIGHLFPVYTGFRGGKGIATLLGLLIGLHYVAALWITCDWYMF